VPSGLKYPQATGYKLSGLNKSDYSAINCGLNSRISKRIATFYLRIFPAYSLIIKSSSHSQ
jgi:hypothetical protein